VLATLTLSGNTCKVLADFISHSFQNVLLAPTGDVLPILPNHCDKIQFGLRWFFGECSRFAQFAPDEIPRDFGGVVGGALCGAVYPMVRVAELSGDTGLCKEDLVALR